MPATCPACAAAIKDSALEATPDTVACPRCGHESRLDALVWVNEKRHTELDGGPSGTSFESDKNGWTLVASTRNGLGCFLVPFTCVWIALLIYVGLDSGFTDYTGVSITLVFTLPLVVLSLMMTSGNITVTVTGNTGKVFTGIGAIGYSRRFDWSAVDHARIERGPRNRWIALIGTRTRFGSLLNDERASYVVGVIRRQAEQDGNR